ncbi:hypothetical protein KKF61_08170, partial [Patescibacteria group bacterium]|nr:hypothetical protein [Patescibacteria group bacterium]
MALTKKQIDEMKKNLNIKPKNDVEIRRSKLKKAAGITDTQGTMGTTARDTIIEPKEKERSLFGKVADVANVGFEKYAGLAKKTGIPQTIGGIIGAGSGLIGGAVGLAGETIKQTGQALIPGGKSWEKGKIWESTKKSAKDTAKFGYGLGSEGTVAAPLGGAGKAVNLAVAYGQGYEGYQAAKEGIKTGNTEQALTGGLMLGTSLYGVKGTMKNKGILVDP